MAENGNNRENTSDMQQNEQKRGGRPRLKRLETADVEFIKKAIQEKYVSLATFYVVACNQAKLAKYKDFDRPSDVETVDRAFDDAFSSRRSLPKLYWKVLEDLLNITPESLQLRIQAANPITAKIESPESTDASKEKAVGTQIDFLTQNPVSTQKPPQSASSEPQKEIQPSPKIEKTEPAETAQEKAAGLEIKPPPQPPQSALSEPLQEIQPSLKKTLILLAQDNSGCFLCVPDFHAERLFSKSSAGFFWKVLFYSCFLVYLILIVIAISGCWILDQWTKSGGPWYKVLGLAVLGFFVIGRFWSDTSSLKNRLNKLLSISIRICPVCKSKMTEDDYYDLPKKKCPTCGAEVGKSFKPKTDSESAGS